MKIIIPSMSRAATMTTHRVIPSAQVCVPQSQAAEYAQVVGKRVLTHPDSVKGLSPKLNWILENVTDPEAIVFIDDDVGLVQRCFVEAGEPSRIHDPELIEEIIRATYILARDVGAYHFGWNPSGGALRYYSGLEPVLLTGYINGCAMGFRTGHGLRFDEHLVAKTDFDISLMNAYRHRRCLRNLRYAFCQQGTFTGRGGLSAYRTSQTEKYDVEYLRRKWGNVFYYGGRSGLRNRDYAGAQKITLNLPFR